MNKRIILCGPTASGKNILRERLSLKGFTFDVSYTTRKIRKEVGEKDGLDYHFIPLDEFEKMENDDKFYEKTIYNGNKYGTGKKEWDMVDVFIMEPHGISCIREEDRKTCFIIYINPPVDERIKRMIIERQWTDEQVQSRIKTDEIKFSDFTDYDMKITNPEF